MNCPNDNTQLLMTDRQGVEIDYCPTCRGVWLDRGELDKLIEKSNLQAPPQVNTNMPQSVARRDFDDDDDYRHSPNKKRKSMLGEMFDF